ncbi:MAG: glycosyltransferase [Limnohabitans sp.]|nr:glycosyltransferase [Limnohabitans sp.]
MKDVTILMSVHNGEKYIDDTVKSILNQDYYEFDFLIVDDGSFDNTTEIIHSFKDSRIKFIRNDKKKGCAYSLNQGLKEIETKYIIRTDADDISRKDRIGKQIEFMNYNKEFGLSGTWFNEFENGVRKYSYTDNCDEIKVQMLQSNPIGHPTVILRLEALRKFGLLYNEKYLYCEDYELWSRCVNHFPISNLKEILVLYRRHAEQISTKYFQQQCFESTSVKLNQIKSFVNLNSFDLSIYIKLLNNSTLSEKEILRSMQIKTILIEENLRSSKYNPIFFETFINKLFHANQ